MAGRKIQYVQQETPSFIKNFKAKVGYKEPDTVDTKFEKLEKSSNEEEDREGEKPVVILGTNVTEQEAREFLEKKRDEEESEEQDHEAEADEKDKHHGNKEQKGKIVFKKPTKRKSGESGKDDRKRQKGKHKSSRSSKAVKNSSLLSFGDEEEEEN